MHLIRKETILMLTLDVLLVLPPMYQKGRIPDYNPKEPMGLMYLAAELRRNGFQVKILDADTLTFTIDETLNEIMNYPAQVIGFSVLQRTLPSVKLLVDGMRNRGIVSHICCGGFTATLSVKHILEKIQGIDSIILGEGDFTFTNLVKNILSEIEWRNLTGLAFRQGDEIIINPPAFKPDLDSLSHPVRDLLPICLEKTNYATILASRGCYGVCTFCSNCSFERITLGSNWRGRNPKDVVDEMESLRQDYEVTVLKFNDPNLFGPGRSGRQHIIDLCQEIIRRDLNDLHLMGFCRADDIVRDVAQLMKQAGFERLLIGIESSDPNVLRLFHKGISFQTISQMISILREVDIDLVPGFMIFNPYTTIKTLEQDITFLGKNNFSSILSKTLRVFDGTPIQRILESENRLVWRSPIEGYHEYLVNPQIAAIYLALKTVYVEWIDLVKKIYQDRLWRIKKAPAFSQRESFDKLNRLFFNIELSTLKALIAWTKQSFCFGDVLRHITEVKSHLLRVETYILTVSGKCQRRLNIESFSEKEMTSRIYSILVNKIFRTFPEQYRWKDD